MSNFIYQYKVKLEAGLGRSEFSGCIELCNQINTSESYKSAAYSIYNLVVGLSECEKRPGIESMVIEDLSLLNPSTTYDPIAELRDLKMRKNRSLVEMDLLKTYNKRLEAEISCLRGDASLFRGLDFWGRLIYLFMGKGWFR